MVELILASEKDKALLNNLLEKYLYDFSQWEKTDVSDDGLYHYEWLDYYFTEENRYPYIIKVDNKLAGFALISDYPEAPGEETDFCLSEFFILHKYRRNGYGRNAVYQILDRHHGRWQLKCHPHNLASVYFWNSVVDEYTGGRYRLVESYPNNEVDYDDGTPANVFFFEN
ncbi:MAG: GNAT family N-acetyltransferase [Huintestinicola sp.]